MGHRPQRSQNQSPPSIAAAHRRESDLRRPGWLRRGGGGAWCRLPDEGFPSKLLILTTVVPHPPCRMGVPARPGPSFPGFVGGGQGGTGGFGRCALIPRCARSLAPRPVPPGTSCPFVPSSEQIAGPLTKLCRKNCRVLGLRTRGCPQPQASCCPHGPKHREWGRCCGCPPWREQTKAQEEKPQTARKEALHLAQNAQAL